MWYSATVWFFLLACTPTETGQPPFKGPPGSSTLTAGTLLPDTQVDSEDSTPLPDDSPPPDPDTIPAPALVFVHIDTLRADRLSGYGYHRETFPLLMAREPEVVQGLHGNSSWTAASVATVLSGLYPFQHGVLTVADADLGLTDAPLTAPSLAEVFYDNGWITLLATGNDFLAPSNGLTTGFDSVLTVGGSSNNRLSGLVELTLAWLDGLPPGLPAFIMIQPMDPHAPYLPDEADRGVWSDRAALPVAEDHAINPTDPEFQQAFAEGGPRADAAIAQAINDTYDETLLSADRALDTLIRGMEAKGREVIVVVSSDHGETLNDDNTLYWGHGGSLRPELLHLPFLVLGAPEPVAVPAGCQWETIDVPHYLLDLAGLPLALSADAALPGEHCRDLVHSELWDPNRFLRALAVEDASWRYTWDCGTQQATVTSVVDDPAALVPLPDTVLPDRARFEAERDRLLGEIEAIGGFCGSEAP